MRHVIGHAATRRVIFVGPFGVGKSTAIRAISDTEVISTDVLSSPNASSSRQVGKHATTVGIDYGEWWGHEDGPIAIIGTPGQTRFRALRDLYLAGSVGVVLLAYGDHEWAVEECVEWVRYLVRQGLGSRLSVTITRTDGPSSRGAIRAYQRALADVAPDIRINAADPRERDDLIRVVRDAVRTFERRTQEPPHDRD